jgi:predicted RNA methylase
VRTATGRGLLAGRYLVNTLDAGGPEDLAIALSKRDLDAAGAAGVPAMPFHQAATAVTTMPRAGAGAVVRVPGWRGYSFLGLLTWLLTGIIEPRSEVVWELAGHPAPRTVHKRLAAMGWQLEPGRSRLVGQLAGSGPSAPDAQPRPRHFDARLGRADLRLEADYGVFSQGEVDHGTRLLIQTMLDQVPAHASLVDVGTGYGPIALALLANRWAGSARGTDIDSVALWLASRNARANTLELGLTLADGTTVAGSGTAVTCNFPTHANRGGSDRLLGDLVAAAGTATVVIVVHQSLEHRFHKRVAALGGRAQGLAAGGHVVLQLSS